MKKHLPINKDKVYFRWDSSKGRKIEIEGKLIPVGGPQIVKRPYEPSGSDKSPVYEMTRWEFEAAYQTPKKRSTKGSLARVRGKGNVSHG